MDRRVARTRNGIKMTSKSNVMRIIIAIAMLVLFIILMNIVSQRYSGIVFAAGMVTIGLYALRFGNWVIDKTVGKAIFINQQGNRERRQVAGQRYASLGPNKDGSRVYDGKGRYLVTTKDRYYMDED